MPFLEVDFKEVIVFLPIVVILMSLVLVVAVLVDVGKVESGFINAGGSIISLGVGVNASSVSWGVLKPNQTAVKPLLISNTGTKAATLEMRTSNWAPSNSSDFMTLFWDYDNSTLLSKESKVVILSLWIHPDIEGIETFSFDITIYANG